MGFGDPFHKHPLRFLKLNEKVDCFRCGLSIKDALAYGCNSCNFHIHELCSRLPETVMHPLHNQHPLNFSTFFGSSNTNLCCSKCQEPLIDGYVYQCSTCQFIVHLSCFLVLDHEKHEHSLRFMDRGIGLRKDCRICGYPINRNSFHFSCISCPFFIHYDCSYIPLTIKHHHVHELTLRQNFPEECDQVYCDRCEDRDGELDRESGLSYYYCEKCDYIAHVLCVAPPREGSMLFKRFNHEHPLGVTKEDILCCNQCDYTVNKRHNGYPSFIKYFGHLEHTLTFVKDDCLFKCTECEFTLDDYCRWSLVYPYGKVSFTFRTNNYPFLCEICGELGEGSRLSQYGVEIHLECFALPGKLEHPSHPHHALYLSSSSSSSSPDEDHSAYELCSVCDEMIDDIFLMYCCLDCNFVAHVTCVANDLLSTFRSTIKNQPDFCAIIEPDETSFKLHNAKIDPCSKWPPVSLPRKLMQSRKDDDIVETETTFKELDLVEEVDHYVCCPNCNYQFPIRAKDS